MSSSTPHFLRVVRALAKVSGASVPLVAAAALATAGGCFKGEEVGSIYDPGDGGCSSSGNGGGGGGGGGANPDCYDGGVVGIAPQTTSSSGGGGYDGGPVGVAPSDAGKD